MASLPVKIRSTTAVGVGKKIILEVRADQFERLVADFGFFSPGFLRSLTRAEKDYRAGRVRKVRSLKTLRTA